MSFGKALISWILTIIFGSILTITLVSSVDHLFMTSDIGAAIIIAILVSSLYSIPAFIGLTILNYLIKKPDGTTSFKGQLIMFIAHLIVGALTFLVVYKQQVAPEIIPTAIIIYPFLGSFIWYKGIQHAQKKEL